MQAVQYPCTAELYAVFEWNLPRFESLTLPCLLHCLAKKPLLHKYASYVTQLCTFFCDFFPSHLGSIGYKLQVTRICEFGYTIMHVFLRLLSYSNRLHDYASLVTQICTFLTTSSLLLQLSDLGSGYTIMRVLLHNYAGFVTQICQIISPLL
ncbi:hypothetical protein NXS19_005961 [Fusarium pseudograminearum]|nr:hypothetical protein NXS19_005961 [Fusarium pseudograminearum]